MKKILQLLLASIVLLLVCISPLQQHQAPALGHSLSPYITADTNFMLPGSFLITEKNKHTDFPEIPSFSFFLLLSLVMQTKLKPHTYSFIPQMKRLYLLYPIRFQSRYLVQGPALI